MRQIVGVVGAGICSLEEGEFAAELGRRIAESGRVLLTGGRGGVMEAASRGARSAGGLTVGVLPGADRGDCNPFVDICLPTGMGEMRNGLVVRFSQVVVAVGGEYGTLSEIALALKMAKPVIGWRTWPVEHRSASDRSIISVASIDDVCQEIERALSPGLRR